jgi:hypothetical protein
MCLFTGRVTHIVRKGGTRGRLGVGVEFFYSEPTTHEISESIRTLANLSPKAKPMEDGGLNLQEARPYNSPYHI